jgi:hypothetical protein
VALHDGEPAAAGAGHADPAVRPAAHDEVRRHAGVRKAGIHQGDVPPVVNGATVVVVVVVVGMVVVQWWWLTICAIQWW